MTVQRRNDELVDILRPDFQHRNEPNFAWRALVSAHLAIPGLRYFWSFGHPDFSGDVPELSGTGYTLTRQNDNTYDVLRGLAGYADLNGNDYYNYPSDGDTPFYFSGTETYIAAAKRGFTCGCWVRTTDLTLNRYYITKWATNNQEYLLGYVQAWNDVAFRVSGNGVAAIDVRSSWTPVTTAWTFVVGRFDPSTETKIWVDRTTDTQAVGVPANLFDGTAPFNVGSYNDGTGSHHYGYIATAWLSAMAVPDAAIQALYEQTRHIFQ